MDIKTCEQYVLNELENTKNRNAELEERNAELEFMLNELRAAHVVDVESIAILAKHFKHKVLNDTGREFICFDAVWNNDEDFESIKNILEFNTEEQNNG